MATLALIPPLLKLTSSRKLNDLVGFIVALVALKVGGSIIQFSGSQSNSLSLGIRTARFTSSTLLWLAKSSVARRVLQRRFPSRAWHQHLLAGRGTLRVVAEYDTSFRAISTTNSVSKEWKTHS